MKTSTILTHKNTGVRFEYLGEFIPQFTRQIFVELLNLKSGKIERFQKCTYKNYFKDENL